MAQCYFDAKQRDQREFGADAILFGPWSLPVSDHIASTKYQLPGWWWQGIALTGQSSTARLAHEEARKARQRAERDQMEREAFQEWLEAGGLP
jgi:hypothetical protein